MADSAQFNQITVANRNGYVVKVSDIGYAEDSYEEPRSAARLDGVPAVTLVVAKQSGENTVATADEVKQRLGRSPPPAAGRAHADHRRSIGLHQGGGGNIKHHLIEGSIFAAIIIFLFLANIRTTLIAAIAIPTSIISTFALMAAMGFTLNQITMLALTLMVGIVIDDAIIVLENIYRFIEEKNMPPFEAAIQGTKEIGLAVMATTLSLLAVFLPVGFMGGIVGRFMSSFGFTSAFAIAVSLLVSFTLTPMLCSRFIKPPEARRGSTQLEGVVHFPSPGSHYTRMLKWSMAHRKTVVASACWWCSRIVPLFVFVGKNFLPAGRPVAVQRAGPRRRKAHRWPPPPMSPSASRRTSAQLPGVQHTLMTVGGSADQIGQQCVDLREAHRHRPARRSRSSN